MVTPRKTLPGSVFLGALYSSLVSTVSVCERLSSHRSFARSMIRRSWAMLSVSHEPGDQ
jgi:hypothetical protein